MSPKLILIAWRKTLLWSQAQWLKPVISEPRRLTEAGGLLVWSQSERDSERLSPKSKGNNASVVTHLLEPSTGEVEVGESGVQGHPQLPSKSEASLDYVKSYLKNPKQQRHSMGEIVGWWWWRWRQKQVGSGFAWTRTARMCYQTELEGGVRWGPQHYRIPEGCSQRRQGNLA